MTSPSGVRAPSVDSGPGQDTRGVVQYAAGSVGMGIYATVPGLLLLYFLTDTLGVSPWLAGATLFVPKVVDILLHPLIGSLSDRDRRGHGSRLRLLVAGCLLALGFIATFTVPGLAQQNQYAAALWVGIWFTIGNTLFALYQVPYLATPTDVVAGYHERTRIMTFRMVVLTLGILVGGALAPLLAGRDSGVRGYATMAVSLGLVMLVFQGIGVLGVRRLAPPVPPTPPELVGNSGHGHPFRAPWAVLRGNPTFRVLVGAYLLMSTTSHLALAGLPYYAKYALDRPGLTTVLVAFFVAPALLATPVWFAISRRRGKQRCLLVAQGIFIAGSGLMLAGTWLGVPVVLVAALMLGVAFSGMQLFPFAMVPDVVRESGDGELDRAGAYSGVWTATEAVGGAAGPYLYSGALALGGFVATRAGEVVHQSAEAHAAVVLGFTLIPIVLMTASLLLQRRYRLDARAQASTLVEVAS